MDNLSTIQDYGLLDNFLNESLKNYNKQLFGEYDDNTGYFDEVNRDEEDSETVDNSQEEQSEGQSEGQTQGSDLSEEQMYNSLFNDNPDNSDNYDPSDPGGAMGGAALGTSSGSALGSALGSGFKSYGSYQEGKQALIHQLELYKSGKSKNATGNETLGELMGIYAPAGDKNDPEAYAKFIAKKLGISVDTPISQIDTKEWADAIEQMEGNKSGNNPGNLRKQAGGKVARTKQQQYVGLNDESLDNLILPLHGTNTIRGLDSGQPVHVQDEYGNNAILYGPAHTTKMKGRVYEKRLKK